MGNELQARTGDLRSAGERLRLAGQRLDADYKALSGQIQGLGGVFGEDMISSLLKASYESAEGVAADCYTSAAEGYADFGAGLATMAGHLDDTERENTDGVQQIGMQI
ncbi:hypothetical protein SAMN04489712_11291 [Thermomonospora echinospora]|uniref:Excreted virulence factor EspC, type VII ESX diderm n=1 Tax=Thermomonospora echinospora TaxID=1992 RepID=A0A1H6D0B4_9ACTN|nr:hypothetical protein [Thermomonospora echinospora]SEG78557.1 hypothetical protein SAMN04489712_11291 [Thermomonospora echinospora]